MSLSIGRAGLNPALVEVSRYEFDGGGQVKLSGWIRGSTSKDMLVAVREQMLGLVDNPDESVVPLVWTEDPSLDGFYRVRQVGMGSEPRMKLDSRSVVPWDATLERVSSYASPQFDSRLLHALRSGSAVTSASASAIQGLAPVTTVYRRGSTGLGDLDTRASADGDVYVNTWATNTSQSSAEWQAPPAGFYDGAATIERRIDGGPWVPFSGKNPVDVDPNTEWRISNGLVQVVPSETIGGTNGTVTVASWGGSAYESATEIKAVWNSAQGDSFSGLTILRNSPEAVTIRLVGANISTNPVFATLDLTLRRGERMLQGVLRTAATTTLNVGAPTSFLFMTTAITGGVRLTSNDADGNRWVLCSALATAPSSGDVALVAASATVLDFGFGHEIGGSGSSGIDTAQALSNQYAAYLSERVDVANP